MIRENEGLFIFDFDNIMVNVILENGFHRIIYSNGNLQVDDGMVNRKILNFNCLPENEKIYIALELVKHNYDCDFYGFCSYNQFLSFSNETYETNEQKWVWFENFDDKLVEKMSFCSKFFIEICTKADIAVSEPMLLESKTLFQMYLEKPGTEKKSIDKLCESLSNISLSFKKVAMQYLNGSLIYPNQLFVMKKEVFCDYMEMNSILIESLNSELKDNPRCKDIVFDFFSFFLGFFYTKKCSDNMKSIVLQRGYVEFPDNSNFIFPIWNDEISILLTSSDYYVPYTAVTICSILENSSLKNKYDIIVFQIDMSDEHMSALQRMLAGYPNFKMQFVDPRTNLRKYDFSQIALDFGVTRFPPVLAYRAFSPYILSNFSRMIWLDCDLVLERDIADLWNCNLHGNVAGMVQDIVIEGFSNGSDKFAYDYYKKHMFMNNILLYCNAGVILFDFEKFRQEISIEELIKRSSEMKHFIPEQDTINCVLEDKVFFLDRRWNVVNFAHGSSWEKHYISSTHYLQYIEARKEPYIIHFVGPDKPWNHLQVAFSDVFWKYARRTPYYEEIISRFFLCVDTLHDDTSLNSSTHNDKKIRKIVNSIFPVGSKRREIIKAIKNKLS